MPGESDGKWGPLWDSVGETGEDMGMPEGDGKGYLARA